MNHPAPPIFDAPVFQTAQEAFVAASALPVVIYGYPLYEAIRTCRVQTSVTEVTGYGRAPVNTLSASDRPWTHEDRDIVTPANDLLYFCAWIDLANGPVTLRIPPHEGMDRYFVIELLDAYTNNFLNLGLRNVSPAGGEYRLMGPGPAASTANEVPCPTNLVWLLGRVLVKGPDDLATARRFEGGFSIVQAPAHARPVCIDHWSDTGDAAVDFFQNLFAALREYPPVPAEQGLFSMLRRVGIRLEQEIEFAALKPPVLQGLAAAYRQGMKIIEANTRSQCRKSWGYSLKLGRYGDDYLLRAATAMKGLGALSADEAVYAMADFDADGNSLDGRHRYELRFDKGMLPPADAFWSVSLYGKDFYFTDNPIKRYAVGNRTPDLKLDTDGSLVIPISHQVAPRTENWLPAPAGPFYLILRLYHPTPEFMAGRYQIPAVRRVD